MNAINHKNYKNETRGPQTCRFRKCFEDILNQS